MSFLFNYQPFYSLLWNLQLSHAKHSFQLEMFSVHAQLFPCPNNKNAEERHKAAKLKIEFFSLRENFPGKLSIAFGGEKSKVAI